MQPKSNILETIRKLAEKAIKYPPENFEELQRFLIAWYCEKYGIPMTSGKAQEIEFETLLLEFHLVNRYKQIENDIKNGKFEAIAQAKEDEEFLKKEMGDDYHEDDDYLVNPEDEKKGPKINVLGDESVPEINESFDIIGDEE